MAGIALEIPLHILLSWRSVAESANNTGDPLGFGKLE